MGLIEEGLRIILTNINENVNDANGVPMKHHILLNLQCIRKHQQTPILQNYVIKPVVDRKARTGMFTRGFEFALPALVTILRKVV